MSLTELNISQANTTQMPSPGDSCPNPQYESIIIVLTNCRTTGAGWNGVKYFPFVLSQIFGLVVAHLKTKANL